jgi:septum site-determining protein MinD
MTRFVAVISGKGGVGKTTTTLNLGQALISLGKSTTLVDANLVTPNLAINLGLISPEGTINKFLQHEKNIHEVMYAHENGFTLIPASPSYSEYQNTNTEEFSRVFEKLDEHSDFVLIDSPSGLGNDINQILEHTDEVILVVNPTLSSAMDALKSAHLASSHNSIIAGFVLNMSNKGKLELSEQEVKDILGYPLLGNIRTSRKMRKAAHKHLPVLSVYPRSKAAKEFIKVAKYLTLEQTI